MPIRASHVDHQWLDTPASISSELLDELVTCWWEVSNAGGAVGFPFTPVSRADVAVATELLARSLKPATRMLLVVQHEGRLGGWLFLERNEDPLTMHWARVLRVQTSLTARGLGIGRAMMAEVENVAANHLGLEQLHIEVRGGQGLEGFYESCGWSEIGRWPGALRLGPGDDRDNVLMLRRLTAKTPLDPVVE